MARDRLRDEATTLLQELLRLDTTNPPGNETPAAELLRDYLEEAGVSCDLLAAEPGRANLVARIPGVGDGKRFLLLSHTDVVPADRGRLDGAARSPASYGTTASGAAARST